MAKRDYYETIGIAREASAADIKKAYRKLAMKYHPDRNPGDTEAEERFKEASEAYEVLSDPEKRARYDRFGHEGVKSTFSGGGFDWSDFTHFEDFGDIFSSLFGFGPMRGGRRRQARGRDLLHEVSITLEQAAKGTEVEFHVNRRDVCDPCRGSGSKDGKPARTCPTCAGTGQVVVQHGFMTLQTTCQTCSGTGQIIDTPCPNCAGSGLSHRRVKLSVKIPPGIQSGQRIQVRGQGDAAPRGGPRGDLFVEVDVGRHPTFAREGDNLVLDQPVTISQLALGDSLSIPTLNGGATTLKIPAGTQTHEVFEIKGEGMPALRGERKGNLYVRVRVVTPKRLNDRQRELLRELSDEDGDVLTPNSESLFDKGRDFLGRIFGG